jgi:hypothetical protein
MDGASGVKMRLADRKADLRLPSRADAEGRVKQLVDRRRRIERFERPEMRGLAPRGHEQSGRVTRLFRQHRIERLSIARAAQPGDDAIIAQETRDLRQRLQVIRAGISR